MKIKALFKGMNSLGYVEKCSYTLDIDFKANGNVVIEADHKGSLCIYTNFETFLNNWTDVSEIDSSKEKDKSLYLIQNKDAGFLGNAIYFWTEGHNGYTASTKKAHKFTYDEAKSICLDNPEKNKAWKFDYIKNNKGTHITTDSQYLDRNEIINFKD